MGRIFESRKATMFARWDRMAKAFTRVGREITVAVKQGGPISEHNPALRRAIQNARSVNMPKDKVEAAIARASGEGAEDYEIIVYEGYAPHGVPLMIETATDNPTRTVANLRYHFKKGNGSFGTEGSVAYMFDQMGVFRIAPGGFDPEELELDLIDHGLEEMGEGTNDEGEDVWIIRCDFPNFGELQSAIEERGLDVQKAESEYIPQTMMSLEDDEADEVMALIDRLEQDDDVQRVFHNLR